MHGQGTHVHTREKYGGLDVAVCGVSVLLSSSITELRPVQAVETPGAIWSLSEVCSHLVKHVGLLLVSLSTSVTVIREVLAT